MYFIHWFHYFYDWYGGAVWGNLFIVPIAVVLGWLWSRTKFWPLRPLNKIYNHVTTVLVHAEHQSKLIEEIHHLSHTGKPHPRVLERGEITPSVDDLLPKSATMQDVVVNPSKEKNK